MCEYVCISVSVHLSLLAITQGCMCVCVCAHTHAAMCAHVHACVRAHTHACMYVCACVRMHVCVCVHVCVRLYAYFSKEEDRRHNNLDKSGSHGMRNILLPVTSDSVKGGVRHDSGIIRPHGLTRTLVVTLEVPLKCALALKAVLGGLPHCLRSILPWLSHLPLAVVS